MIHLLTPYEQTALAMIKAFNLTSVNFLDGPPLFMVGGNLYGNIRNKKFKNEESLYRPDED
jgi:hypothetical protein